MANQEMKRGGAIDIRRTRQRAMRYEHGAACDVALQVSEGLGLTAVLGHLSGSFVKRGPATGVSCVHERAGSEELREAGSSSTQRLGPKDVSVGAGRTDERLRKRPGLTAMCRGVF
jgi:hypothetical protein